MTVILCWHLFVQTSVFEEQPYLIMLPKHCLLLDLASEESDKK